MMPEPYPLVLQNAVSPDFVAYVNRLIQQNIDEFQSNNAGANRQYLKMDYVAPDGDRILFEAKQRLAAHYELGEYVVPPKLKDFLGYITEGGAIHPHTDPDLRNRRHVRINVLVSQTKGCIPLLDDIPIAVKVGDAWLNLASKCVHATTRVEGPGYRSALSFGYQIDPRRGDELLDIHEEWLSKVRTTAGGH
jgi:hypothetical protein